MKEIEKIYEFIDSKPMRSKSRRSTRTKRVLGIPVTALIAVAIMSMVVTGAYISGLGNYAVTMDGNIDTVDSSVPDLVSFDGVLLTEASTVVTMDLTEFTEIGTQTFVHSVFVDPDNGNFDISFDTSGMDAFLNIIEGEPGDQHTHAGFFFDIEDQATHTSILDETTTVLAGETLTMDFLYTLDDNFWNPLATPVLFDLSILIEGIVEAEIIPTIGTGIPLWIWSYISGDILHIESVEPSENGKIQVNFTDGTNEEYDRAVYALGGTTPKDILVNSDVKTGEWDVPVFDDKTLETNVPGLYTIGDVVTDTGSIALAFNHASFAMNNIVAKNK